MSRPSRPVLLLLAVLVVLVLGTAAALLADRGRGRAPRDGSGPLTSLEDLQGRWRAVDGSAAPAPLAAPVVLEVDGDELLVWTGCNSGGGPADVDDSRLVLAAEGLAITEMACPAPGLMAQEAWVLDMLQARPRLERSGPALVLLWGERDRYRLRLEPDGGR